MRPSRHHKPDSLLFLFVLVTVGMLLTSIVQADDYLFGHHAKSGFIGSDYDSDDMTQFKLPASSDQRWLLLPGTDGMKTSFKDGMVHFLYAGNHESGADNVVFENTRFIFSLGVEDKFVDISNYSSEIYNRYQPVLYFTVGRRW